MFSTTTFVFCPGHTFHQEFSIFQKIVDDLKAKLASLKKKKVTSDESVVETEGESASSDQPTDAGVAADKTSVTDIGDLASEDLTDVGDELQDALKESPAPKSILDKLKAAVNRGAKPKDPAKAAAAEEEVSEEDAKAAKPKQNPKKLIIYGAIGLGLVGLLLMPEDEPVPEVAEVKTIPKDRKPKKNPLEDSPPATTETPATDPTTEVKPDPAVVDAPVDPVVTPPTDTIPTPDTLPTPDSPVVDAPPVVDTPPVVDLPTDVPVDVPQVDVPTDPVVDVPVPDAPVDPTVTEPSTTDVPPSDTTVSNTEDTIDGDAPKNDGDMTDQILKDLEDQVKKEAPKREVTTYVSPPDYEYRGRGLVYNCAGKHWACVDGSSYKSCEDNYSSTKYLKKTVECYPFNVYEAPRGCELMQNRVVSSSVKTDFCK